MNFKKIAITAAIAGTILASAMPAFASDPDGFGGMTILKNQNTHFNNTVKTVSNTGKNNIWGGEDGALSTIVTGSAFAGSSVTNKVNTNVLSCGCLNHDGLTVLKNKDTHFTNTVTTVTNTGKNNIHGDEGNSTIVTGGAGGTSLVDNTVNTNMVGGFPF